MIPFIQDILDELTNRGYTVSYDMNNHTLIINTTVIDWIDKMARNIRRGLISFNEAIQEIIRYTTI